MINITIERSLNGYITGFKVEGHANYAEHGSDIICAAVSAVSIGFANVLIDKDFTYKPELVASEGFIHLQLDKRVSEYESVETLLDAILHIFKQIESQYPDYVNIEGGHSCLQV